MRVLIVHAHPEPKRFNGAMTRAATAALQDAGHSVHVSSKAQAVVSIKREAANGRASTCLY